MWGRPVMDPTVPEEPKQDARYPSEIQILYYRVKQAEKNFIKVRRRWVKTARTYLPTFDFILSARSELVRTHKRLLEADKKHDEAYSQLILARREWRLLKTFTVVSKRAKRRPDNLALQNVALLAETRLLRFRCHRMEAGSEVTSFWNLNNSRGSQLGRGGAPLRSAPHQWLVVSFSCSYLDTFPIRDVLRRLRLTAQSGNRRANAGYRPCASRNPNPLSDERS